MKNLTSIILPIFLIACATPGEVTDRQKRKILLKKDNVIQSSVRNERGDVTEYIFVQESDIEFEIKSSFSEAAQACESYARQKPAQNSWIDNCDTALKDPSLSPFNQAASLYNKALILSNLTQTSDAKGVLNHLIQKHPTFNEADYELARLEYEDENFSLAKTYAQSAIDKNLKRPSRAYYIIGKAHENDFDFSSARQAYEKGLSHDEGNGKLRRSLERLNRLWPET